MAQFILSLIKTARPRQWLKNSALLASLIFSGQLFYYDALSKTLLGIIAFCFLSSSNYIFNDIKDRHADNKHPQKKFRPIASGKISPLIAGISSFAFAIMGLLISASLSPSFAVVASIYLLFQFLYTQIFKHISIIDILIITLMYFLRVYAGEVLIGYHISIWLTISVFSLALFLAIGKRRAELTLLSQAHIDAGSTRLSLAKYPEPYLDILVVLSANSTFITYSYFSFLERSGYNSLFLTHYKSFFDAFLYRKWFMLTIPFVLYGIMRYMQLIYDGQGESPEKILTSDVPLFVTILTWGGLLVFIIYGIGIS